MTEITADSAAVMSADYQGMFALVLGDTIQQITSFTKRVLDPQTDSKTDNAEISETCEKDIVKAITPPIIHVVQTEKADRSITIQNVPPVNAYDLNYSILERVLNHVKDAYIKGRHEDAELKEKCAGREFKFCMTYFFQHDGEQTLMANFCVSHTKDAPAWITNPNPKAEDHLTPMSDDEVNLIADAFIRQCEHALSNYVNMVFNDAIENGIEPNYYNKQFPMTKPTVK